MNVARAVVAHRDQVQILQQIERLQHDRPLCPAVQFVHFDAFVGRHQWLLELHLPVGEVGYRVQPAQLTRPATVLLGDVACVKTRVSRIDGLLPVLAGVERPRLGLDELLQGGEQVRLPPDFARARPFPFFTRVREENLLRIGPFLQLLFVTLDLRRGLGLDRITGSHLHRRSQHLLERKGSELREHHQQPPGSAGGHGGQWTVSRRILEFLRFKKIRRRAAGRNPQRVDANDLVRDRIVNQRLRFAAPAQLVIHCANDREHRARRIDGIAAALEHARARRSAERFAGDGNPMPAVKNGFVRRGIRLRRSSGADARDEQNDQPEAEPNRMHGGSGD